MTPEKQALPIVAWLCEWDDWFATHIPPHDPPPSDWGDDPPRKITAVADHAAASSRIAELEAQNAELRAHLDAALDVVVDLGGEVRLPEIEEAKRLRARLAELEAQVRTLTADRDSWADQCSRRLADWDEMRQRAEKAEARLEAAEADARRLAILRLW